MIKSQFTLKQLEAFVFVADQKSFRKAALALGTTQPNVSVRIAALEATLGTVLMHRDAGTVRLTEKGAELLVAARSVLRAAETMLDVAGQRAAIAERMRLGVTELVAATWLHQFLREFRTIYPSIRVELTVNLSADVMKDLAADQLDLAILNDAPNGSPFQKTPLGSHRYGWVATPDVAAALGPKPKWAEVFAKPVLTHARHANASIALAEFAQARKLPVDQIVHSNSLTACLHMAVDGMGITLLPRQIYQPHITSGLLTELDMGWEPDPLKFSALYDADKMPLFVAAAAEMAVRHAQTDT